MSVQWFMKRNQEGTVSGGERRSYRWLLATAVVLLALVMPMVASTSTIPTITVDSVVTNDTVTITTHDFPANQTFTVTMGKMGTAGIDGIVVGTINSGAGGTMSFTFNIPAALQGDAQIAIRAQTAHANPYYAYNWFWNETASVPGDPIVHAGIPTFSIVSVAVDDTVTIRTNNFPMNQSFAVTMGAMGTRGVGGIVVGTIDSGSDTSADYTFAIPDALKGSYQIAIRAETAHANPFYAYNWFYNNTTGSGTGGTPGYTGIPTFSISSVVADDEVTILTNNFPTDQSFTVTMGEMYTRGIDGIVVGTIDTESDTSAEYTFEIPDALKGNYRISIRAETDHANPYYAFNWFYNNTADGGDGAGTGGVYVGIPTFKVCAVEADANVTILTNNFPVEQTFTMTMGPMFTRGINGTVVGTLDSGDGANTEYTFSIPGVLAGADRISIRAETAHSNPFYAFNWFWNNTADVCP